MLQKANENKIRVVFVVYIDDTGLLFGQIHQKNFITAVTRLFNYNNKIFSM